MNRIALWAESVPSMLMQGTVAGPMARLFVNAQALTMDVSKPRAEAMLIKRSIMIAVGERKVLEARVPAGTRVIDLQGQIRLPFFVDG